MTDLKPIPIPAPPKAPWTQGTIQHTGERTYYNLTAEALAAHRVALKAWHAEAERIERHNRALAEKAAEMLNAAGFPSHRTVTINRGFSGLKREVLIKVLRPFVEGRGYTAPMFPDPCNIEERWLQEQVQVVARAEQAKQKQELRDRAVTWLLARGKVYGPDFTADTALETANGIAADEEIARLSGVAGTFVRFDGDDECEDCKGWDGVSRRCDCGNRRVSWETMDWHTFEEPAVRGVAW